MKAPNVIFIWNCENQLSQRYYTEKQKAFNAVIRKFTLPQSFGLPAYIKATNESMLEEIKKRVKYANSAECVSKAKLGVKNAQLDIEFKSKLENLLNED